MKLVAALLLMPAANAAIDYSRFHCVAREPTTGNYLFRSNMPLATNATGFAYAADFGYDDIKDFVQQRAPEECGPDPAPDDFFLVEVTLNNALDDTDGLLAVHAWHGWPDNMGRGRLVDWPLIGALAPAGDVPEDKRGPVSEQLFVVDQIPDRVAALNRLLTSTPAWAEGKPLVVVVHCSAGCDRTGEMIGSWRLTVSESQPTQMTAAEAYNLNVAECGRAPNCYSTHALEWYCLLLQDQGVTGLGDCLGFATCTSIPEGGKCEPTTNVTTVQ